MSIVCEHGQRPPDRYEKGKFEQKTMDSVTDFVIQSEMETLVPADTIAGATKDDT